MLNSCKLISMLYITSLILQVAGHVLIALVVLSVHMHVAKEKRIDKAVLLYMKKEQLLVILGIALILAGFFIEFYIELM